MRCYVVLVNAGWFATYTQAYAPSNPIQWTKTPTKRVFIAPKDPLGNFRGTSSLQQLTLKEETDNMSPDMLPRFTVNLDESITLDDLGCIEAIGRETDNSVRLNRCTGSPNQKWNWIRIPNSQGRHMIQLMHSNKCLDVRDESIVLRECEVEVTDSWKFEEPVPLPTQTSFVALSEMRHAMLSIFALAGIGALSLAFAAKIKWTGARTLVPASADASGVPLTALSAAHGRDHRRSAECSMFAGSSMNSGHGNSVGSQSVRHAHAKMAAGPQAKRISCKDADGDTVEFAIEGGDLVKYVNGFLRVGNTENFSDGIVTSLTYSIGADGPTVCDQYGWGSRGLSDSFVGQLRDLADSLDIPNNLPEAFAVGARVCTVGLGKKVYNNKTGVITAGQGEKWIVKLDGEERPRIFTVKQLKMEQEPPDAKWVKRQVMLEAELARKDAKLTDKESEIIQSVFARNKFRKELDVAINEYTEEREELEANLAEKESEISEKESILTQQSSQIAEMSNEISELSAQLTEQTSAMEELAAEKKLLEEKMEQIPDVVKFFCGIKDDDEVKPKGGKGAEDKSKQQKMQDFLEFEPYSDVSTMPMNTYKPKSPFTGKVRSVEKIVGPNATGETYDIIIEHEGKMPFVEGQSFGVIPPGEDPKTGKPNKVRLYSIASSRYGDDMEGTSTTLCVRRATYWCPELKAEDPAKKGVCSNFLCDAKAGDTLKMTGPTGKALLLPESNPETDIIMVATGTGIAPFRSFLRRMFVEKTPYGRDFKGLAWLFLGVANTDSLLYDEDWKKIAKENPERFRYDVALSREQKNKDGGKMYIQDKVEEYADEIFDRLDKGAHMYFCGLRGMMPGIQDMLKRVAERKEMDIDEFTKNLKSKGQWHVEVY